jgi:hypothetical protein
MALYVFDCEHSFLPAGDFEVDCALQADGPDEVKGVVSRG